MTRRKPPSVTFGDWVERQIVEAQQEGQFDELPGSGRPIPVSGEPADGMAWLAARLRREDVDLSTLLPPALALAKEVENLPLLLAQLRSEAAVRATVDDLNTRIKQAHRVPHDGPPVRVMPLDVDAQVAAWLQARESLVAPETTPETGAPAAESRRRLSLGWGRTRRSS